MVARKHLDDAAADGKPISDVQNVVEEQWAKVPYLIQAAQVLCAVMQTMSVQCHIRLLVFRTAACSLGQPALGQPGIPPPEVANQCNYLSGRRRPSTTRRWR